jgi:hypothetical protein
MRPAEPVPGAFVRITLVDLAQGLVFPEERVDVALSGFSASWHYQAECLGRVTVAGVLLELNSAAGGSGV